ncbi:hypothetical protein [Solirubrobacter soli]|uniref:hypothetical protein n=1 Tax=Solirubrobacter soli TaxID=363832 RepID=UPI000429382C|nr:hypothetical protein [Solirubrobacter soli]
MLRLIATTAVLLLVGAGVARADDCEFEGTAGSTRAPVTARGLLLADSFADEGALDDGEVDLWTLTRSGHAAGTSDTGDRDGRPFSPTLVTRPDGDPEIVEWRGDETGGAIIAVDRGVERVLVPGVAFPGYDGVAAAEGPDGTITLLYGGVLERVAPDGTAGPAIPVAPHPFAPLLAVDGQGTVFGAARGDGGGVAIRWPQAGTPTLTSTAALARPTTEPVLPRVVPDGHGGAWLKTGHLSLLRLSADGVTVTRVTGAADSATDPVVDAEGDAVIGWSEGHRAYVQTVSTDGTRSRRTALPSRDVEGLALDPRSGDPWVLTHVHNVLALQTPGRTIAVRGRRRYGEFYGSVAIDATGRAWVVWQEESDRLDSECHLFPAVADVRWATFGLRSRHVSSHVLSGASPIS